MNKVDDKNPVDNLGRTPKQLMLKSQECKKWLSETFSPSNFTNSKNLESLYYKITCAFKKNKKEGQKVDHLLKTILWKFIKMLVFLWIENSGF